jgi:hypothetical protein
LLGVRRLLRRSGRATSGRRDAARGDAGDRGQRGRGTPAVVRGDDELLAPFQVQAKVDEALFFVVFLGGYFCAFLVFVGREAERRTAAAADP